jgi:hypothetical protein
MTSAAATTRPTESVEKTCTEKLRNLSLGPDFLTVFEEVTYTIGDNIENFAVKGGPSFQLVRAYDEASAKFGALIPIWASRTRMTLLGSWVRAGCPLH